MSYLKQQLILLAKISLFFIFQNFIYLLEKSYFGIFYKILRTIQHILKKKNSKRKNILFALIFINLLFFYYIIKFFKKKLYIKLYLKKSKI